ncbi:MAG: tyrosine-type recombinase/integrase [Chloroflexi bacterium]|nr:tyrosine-type recombinase/integrase [Chloroflexota bacterium]
MNTFTKAVDDYLKLRRALGAKLLWADSVFRSFADCADREGVSHLTTALVLRWVTAQTGVLPSTQARRFQLVRGFTVWYSAMDSRTEIPPKDLVSGRFQRQAPYIYTQQEIEQIIEAARCLLPRAALKRHTFATIYALLATTGMRACEVLALDRDDVALEQGVLHIRNTKFGKFRLVPVHESTSQALSAYARQRDRLIRQPMDPAFFLSDRGVRVNGCSMRYNFARISQCIGLRPQTANRRHGRGPRLHDMRHRFAVQTLVTWYRNGVDVERQMPKLSTYLGHAHINDTYWYIEAVPELLALATGRLVNREARQ